MPAVRRRKKAKAPMGGMRKASNKDVDLGKVGGSQKKGKVEIGELEFGGLEPINLDPSKNKMAMWKKPLVRRARKRRKKKAN